MSSYSDYYKAKLEGALLYQDFVVDVSLQVLGLAIIQYGSRAYQLAVGESRTGVEIKHDEKLKQTGNLWIETGERARPRDTPYAPSGIYRTDNTWLYVIGDYDRIFYFPKQTLRLLHQAGRYRVLENNTHTSTGFLMPEADARKFAAITLEPNAQHKVSRTVKDTAELGRILHAAAKANPAQGSLFDDDPAFANQPTGDAR